MTVVLSIQIDSLGEHRAIRTLRTCRNVQSVLKTVTNELYRISLLTWGSRGLIINELEISSAFTFRDWKKIDPGATDICLHRNIHCWSTIDLSSAKSTLRCHSVCDSNNVGSSLQSRNTDFVS